MQKQEEPWLEQLNAALKGQDHECSHDVQRQKVLLLLAVFLCNQTV